jgi:predicted DNA-binding transcriptional regulator YafY
MARDLTVWSTMRSEDLTVDEAAERFSVTVRTVFRIMRRCREAAPDLDGAVLQVLAAA